MASPGGGFGPNTAEDDDQRRYIEISSDSESDGSYEDNDSINASSVCRYQTADFYDGECLRYFDCPSHIVERSLSDAEDEGDDDVDMDNSETANATAPDPATDGEPSSQIPHTESAGFAPVDAARIGSLPLSSNVTGGPGNTTSSTNTPQPDAHSGPGMGGSSAARGTYYSTQSRILAGTPPTYFPASTSASAYPGAVQSRHRSMLDVGSSSSSSAQNRALPPPPPVLAEEDECPICHRELPPRNLPNFEALREAHITVCITSHSTYLSGGGGASSETPQDSVAGTPPLAARRTGMFPYVATEKDCVDSAECTICLEEFVTGVHMARLECLCRFHRSCISAWFINHPGRCPVHQHDSYGY
ncbi:hypothetical protein ACHAQA_002453 [Verticillium albo-atrum]